MPNNIPVAALQRLIAAIFDARELAKASMGSDIDRRVDALKKVTSTELELTRWVIDHQSIIIEALRKN